MSRPLRILSITAGLSVAGALCGALAGAVAMAIALALTEGPLAAFDAAPLIVAAAYGAVLGTVTAPVLAWLLLRRVSFCAMFANGIAGTVAGGVLGWIFQLAPDQMSSALLGATAGCVIASVSLRSRTMLARMLGDSRAVDWGDAAPHRASRRLHRSAVRG